MGRRWIKNSLIGFGGIIILSGLFGFSVKGRGEEAVLAAGAGRAKKVSQYRVLYVMSYNSPWEWTDDQFNGFKKAMVGVKVEYKSFQLDTKRKSSPEWKKKVGREACQLIDAWKPDLVYTSDDNAQLLVTKYYVNKNIPFVFSAVNDEPSQYGLVPSKNITGVMEREHFVETLKLLRQIKPGITKIAIITDDDPTWKNLHQRIKEVTPQQFPDVKLVSFDVIHTFRDYQAKVREYQTKVDAVGLIGIHIFKDQQGNNVPWQDVLKWTTFNSRLPDFSFYQDRIYYGTLCSVHVSGFEQGYAAGKIARGILVDGKSPASFPIKYTEKGKPVVSLARARRLGIKIKSKLLLSTQVVGKFAWEK